MSDISNNGNGMKKSVRKILISKKPQKPKGPVPEEVVIDDITQDAGGEVVPVPEIVPQLNEGKYNEALTMESDAPGNMDGYDIEEFLHFGDSDADEAQDEDREEASEYDENDDSENYEDDEEYTNDENYDDDDGEYSDDENYDDNDEYEEYEEEDSEDGSYDSDEYDQYDDSDNQYDDSDSEEYESEEYYDDDDDGDDVNNDIPDGEYTAIYDDEDNNDGDDGDFLNSFDEDGSDYDNDDGDEDQSFEVEDLDENDETEDDVVEEEAVQEPIRQPVQVQTFKSDVAKSPKRQIRIQQNNRPNNTTNVRSDKINKLVNSRSSMNVDDVPDSPRLNFEKPQKEEYQDISSTSSGNPYSVSQAFNNTTNNNQVKQDSNPVPQLQPQQQQQQPINRSFIRQQQQQPQPQSQQFQQPAPAPRQVRQPVMNQPVQQQQQQQQKVAFDNRSNFDYPSQTVQNKEQKDFLDTINSIFDRFKFFFFVGGFSILCLLIIIMGLLK